VNHSLKIHYSDDDILVVDKPSGMPCLPVSGSELHDMMSAIVELYPEQANSVPASSSDMGLVHRLDNETSGIILVARNNKTWSGLREQFENKSVHKKYVALVMGSTPPEGVISMAIAHHGRKRKKMVVCESEARASEMKARPANTEYQTVEHLIARNGNIKTIYSLISVVITTGVRHQIRAHLASIGFPLAGDKLYQPTKRHAEDILEIPRHFLHASSISFQHPTSGIQISFSSELPKELAAVLNKLEAMDSHRR
jgi:23S rRNA pseudouridine1911/1915/1917 synthase